jgi:hypoxanthine-guanine phosphoribosyltransferase
MTQPIIIAHQDQIAAAWARIAQTLTKRYQHWLNNQPLTEQWPAVIVYIPHGGIFPTVDLTRLLTQPIWNTLHFGSIHYSRYGNNLTGTKQQHFTTELPNLNNRFVVLIDDVVDQGITFAKAIAHLKTLNADTIITCSGCYKAKQMDPKHGCKPDYTAVTIYSDNNLFLLGQGMDGQHCGRQHLNISIHPNFHQDYDQQKDQIIFYQPDEIPA